MNILAIQRGLWVAVLAAQVILIGLMVRRGLARRYPFFLVYLTADAIWGVTLIQIDFRTTAYALGFRAYLIMTCVLQVAVAGELYERICEHFRGIGKFRLYMAASLTGFAGILSFATFWPDLAAQWAFPQTLVIWIERLEATVLCGVLILTRLFLHNFMNARPPIRPNVTRHWLLLSLYFGVVALASASVLLTGGGNANYIINLAMLGGELACLLLWSANLKSDGERLPYAHKWSPEGLARRRAIADRVLELVERTRDELLNRR